MTCTGSSRCRVPGCTCACAITHLDQARVCACCANRMSYREQAFLDFTYAQPPKHRFAASGHAAWSRSMWSEDLKALLECIGREKDFELREAVRGRLERGEAP